MIVAAVRPRWLASGLPVPLVSAAGLALSSAINLAAILLWARWLGAAEFGKLALIMAVGLLLNALAFEWLRLAGARTLLQSERIDPSRLAAFVRANAATACALFVVVGAASAAGLVPFGGAWLLSVVLVALGESAIGVVALVARLELRAWRFATLLVARALLAVVGGAILVRCGYGATGIACVSALAALALAAAFVGTDRTWAAARSAPANGAGKLVRLGLPLIGASALALANGMADRLIVGASLGAAAAGALAAPSDLVARTLGFAMMALNLSAYPLLVRQVDGDDPAAASRAVRRNGLIQLTVALPLTACLILFAEPLCSVLLGSAFPDAPRLLPWLAGAALLRLLATFHHGVAFQLERRMRLVMVAPGVSLLVLLSGAAPAIRAGGLDGLVQLGLFAQAAGLAAAALLTRTSVGHRPQRPSAPLR